jgi:hypothetical protein
MLYNIRLDEQPNDLDEIIENDDDEDGIEQQQVGVGNGAARRAYILNHFQQ